jgi:hypothetical protein
MATTRGAGGSGLSLTASTYTGFDTVFCASAQPTIIDNTPHKHIYFIFTFLILASS